MARTEDPTPVDGDVSMEDAPAPVDNTEDAVLAEKAAVQNVRVVSILSPQSINCVAVRGRNTNAASSFLGPPTQLPRSSSQTKTTRSGMPCGISS